ncbi:TBC1 domain family member 13, partial [Operophtera brumata]
IPHEKGLRAFVWKILLNYIPLQKSAQESDLTKKRQLYQSFLKDIVVLPQGPPSDHPLSISPDSEWNTYFKDNEVLLQIDKDARRLCPDINFFQSATEFPCAEIVNSNGLKRLHTRVEQCTLNISTMERKGLGVGSGDYRPLNEGSEAHWEVVERMLFLYAKYNSGQGYVQGMNEIIGPIYHTFACDPVREFRRFI